MTNVERTHDWQLWENKTQYGDYSYAAVWITKLKFKSHNPWDTIMVVDRIMEMEKRFVMGQQTTAARRGPIFP